MLAHLANTKTKWEKADPTTPVLPAIEYIAMVAQADAGVDGMYRAVMPDKEIEKAYALAKRLMVSWYLIFKWGSVRSKLNAEV